LAYHGLVADTTLPKCRCAEHYPEFFASSLRILAMSSREGGQSVSHVLQWNTSAPDFSSASNSPWLNLTVWSWSFGQTISNFIRSLMSLLLRGRWHAAPARSVSSVHGSASTRLPILIFCPLQGAVGARGALPGICSTAEQRRGRATWQPSSCRPSISAFARLVACVAPR
jgi:hypothetical protein